LYDLVYKEFSICEDVNLNLSKCVQEEAIKHEISLRLSLKHPWEALRPGYLRKKRLYGEDWLETSLKAFFEPAIALCGRFMSRI